MASRVSWVAEPICGKATTLAIVGSVDEAASGSCSKTSSPAACIAPLSRACINAASSTTLPRAILMKMP
eukprot:19551-Eustigmatos_ZCMA.PRE.1